MNIRIVEKEQSDEAGASQANAGGITFAITLDAAEATQLAQDAARAYRIEQGLPADARTAFGGADEGAYRSDFMRTRVTNDALEARGIVPVAAPVVTSDTFSAGESYTCEITVHPRPEIGLTSLEPVDLAVDRIPKPGFSAQAGRAGDESVEYLEDEKALRMALVRRLDSELPESAMKALADEYQRSFEAELAARHIDPESYQLAHGINEEQYNLMMARHALGDAHWNYALDAVFVGNNFTISEDDLRASLEVQHPGCGDTLMELYELRGELWKTVEKVRRGKALMWLKDNAIR